MSFGGISSAVGLGQGLVALLGKLTGSQSASSVSSGNSDDFDESITPSSTTATTSSSNALTGSSTAALSNQILSFLTMLQQQAGSPTPSSSPSSSTNTATDPLSQLISAMDTDNSGTVSQTEMESYIQKMGGTTAQADALFAGLNQGGTGDLTKAQLTDDLQQTQAVGGGGGHHHHHHHMPSADKVGDQLTAAMDSNGDGSVDSSEFSSFITSQGGSSSEAATDFAALDPGNTGSINAAQFTSAIQAFEKAGATAASAAGGATATSPILTLLDSLGATNKTASAMTNVTA